MPRTVCCVRFRVGRNSQAPFACAPLVVSPLRQDRLNPCHAAGVMWVIAFFLVRILPSPFMVYKMVYGSYAAFSAFDFWLCITTCPLPFVLNSYWWIVPPSA